MILIDSWANLNQFIDETKSSSHSTELESMKLIREYYGAHSSHFQLIQKHLSWLRSYIPTSIDIPVILLKAERILPYYKDLASEDNGWKAYLNQLFATYKISGNHDTMLKSENLQDLCALLQILLS